MALLGEDEISVFIERPKDNMTFRRTFLGYLESVFGCIHLNADAIRALRQETLQGWD